MSHHQHHLLLPNLVRAAACWLMLLLLLLLISDSVTSHAGGQHQHQDQHQHQHHHSQYSDPNSPRDHSEANKNVLILGGNGFIGSHLVERLVAMGYNVTTMHRNNTYWQWRSDKYSHVIRCDRNYDLTQCDSLVTLESQPFLAVVDLSGFVDVAVMQGIQLLASRFQYYLYLSTDSVYDISDKQHAGASRESDGAFPADPEVRDRLRSGRTYAERKLTSEFVVDLLAADYNGHYDYSIVRIPDTFGPRDTSYRFWYYMRSLDEAGSGRLRLPESTRDTRVSFAYVGDVADFLAGLVDRYRREARSEQVKEVFNFGYADTWTMTEFVEHLAQAMGHAGAPGIRYTDSATQHYPSVTSGPINVEKVSAAFPGWLPATPLAEALRQSVAFYRDVESRPGDFAEEVARFQELMAEWRGDMGGGGGGGSDSRDA